MTGPYLAGRSGVMSQPSPSPAMSLVRGSLSRMVLTSVALLLVVNALAAVTASWVLGYLATHPSWSTVILLGVLQMTWSLTWVAALWCWRPAIQRTAGRWRRQLLERALSQRMDDLAETSAGALVDRIDDDTNTVARALSQSGVVAISATITAVAATVAAMFATVWAMPAFIFVGITIIWTTHRKAPQVTAAGEQVEAAWTDVSIVVDEAVLARDDVRAMSGRAHVLARYGESIRGVLAAEKPASKVRAHLSFVVGLIFAIAVCATLIAVTVATHTGHLSVTDMVALMALVLTFVSQVRMITGNYPQILGAIAAAHRITDLSSVPVEPHSLPTSIELAPQVEFRDVTFTYGEDLPLVLENVSFTIPANHSCGIVGRTGSGKSTLVALLTRQVATPPGMIFVAGHDVCDLDPRSLRQAVGVVSQRTELLAGSVADNVTLFADLSVHRVEDAFSQLGLDDWVASLADGLDTQVGPGGLTLSSGEEQLIAFARLLVRNPAVVVLDEATARMDPVTDIRVARAAARLLAGRTGIVVAHRLATLRSCDEVAVMADGHLIDFDTRRTLLHRPGPFMDLVVSSRLDPQWLATDDDLWLADAPNPLRRRQSSAASATTVVGDVQSEDWVPPLWRTVARLLWTDRRNGLLSLVCWAPAAVIGIGGLVANLAWGEVVGQTRHHQFPYVPLIVFCVGAFVAVAIEVYPHRRFPLWWTQASSRLRGAIVAGQLDHYRVRRRPPGEVVSRAFSADRVLELADDIADLMIFTAAAVIPAFFVVGLLPGSLLAASIAIPFVIGLSVQRFIILWAKRSADARARAAVLLASIVDAARTVKLFAATAEVTQAYAALDSERVACACDEARKRTLIESAPSLVTSIMTVAIWAVYVAGWVSLPITLAASATLGQLSYAGWVALTAAADAADARYWLSQAAPLAQNDDLVTLLPEISFTGDAPQPLKPASPVVLDELRIHDLTVVHDDGTIGVSGCSFSLGAGQLVLVVGEIGSGKSSLLGAIAGLYGHTGQICWNDHPVEDPEVFLRPGQVAWVGQVPRVLSGSFVDNVALGHDRDVDEAVAAACMAPDVLRAGGARALIGHRGVRLSGGQVQRLALARALAARTELVIADDVSSALDAGTEVEVWASLHERGCAVIAASCKLAALQIADEVVVLDAGRQVACGTWASLASTYGHLAA